MSHRKRNKISQRIAAHAAMAAEQPSREQIAAALKDSKHAKSESTGSLKEALAVLKRRTKTLLADESVGRDGPIANSDIRILLESIKVARILEDRAMQALADAEMAASLRDSPFARTGPAFPNVPLPQITDDDVDAAMAGLAALDQLRGPPRSSSGRPNSSPHQQPHLAAG